MDNRRSMRRSRKTRVNTDGFSEEARKERREPQSLRHDAFSSENYGRKSAGSGSYDQAYSRRVSQAEYTKTRKKRQRKKVMFGALAAVLVLVLGGAGVALAYYGSIEAKLKEGLDPELADVLVKTDLAKEPFYMLLMGVDGSEERAESAEYAGDNFRSDSIMLARIDPVNVKVTLISLHRDTLIDMGEYGQQKLNAAHALGGASLAVKTVSEFAGVPISHYASINFDGFREIVDMLGGIEVDVPMEINDQDAGGHLDAGPQTLNGEQALILCRARHAYDDYGDGDTYRAANQRLVLSAIAKKILSSDVVTMGSTISSMSSYLTTDLDVMDIVGLAQVMRSLNPETDIYSAMEPTTSQLVGGVWYEFTNVNAWKEMMNRVDQGLPPTDKDIIDERSGTVLATTGSGTAAPNPDSGGGVSAPKTGSISVKNGSGIAGVAAEAGDKLQKVGYTVETGNADAYDYPETIVVYQSASQANEAKEIATTIGIGKAQLNNGTYSFNSDFLVVIGSDWS